MPRAVGLLLLAALACGAQASEIYRWVDENGKTHVSNVVPEKYKKAARRIDTGQAPSPEARREAEERAAADRARAAASAAAAAARPAPAPAPAAAAVPAETECERAYRLYEESLACFAPFLNANGTMKGEAIEKCTPVPDPSRRCGPPKPHPSIRN
jgi:hypothetical protein